jgi:hypothetical protein
MAPAVVNLANQQRLANGGRLLANSMARTSSRVFFEYQLLSNGATQQQTTAWRINNGPAILLTTTWRPYHRQPAAPAASSALSLALFFHGRTATGSDKLSNNCCGLRNGSQTAATHQRPASKPASCCSSATVW